MEMESDEEEEGIVEGGGEYVMAVSNDDIVIKICYVIGHEPMSIFFCAMIIGLSGGPLCISVFPVSSSHA